MIAEEHLVLNSAVLMDAELKHHFPQTKPGVPCSLVLRELAEKKKHLQTYARKCVSQPCLKPESRTRAFKRRRFMFSEVAQKFSMAATKTARLCAAFIWLLYVIRAVLRGKLIVLEEEKNDQMVSNDVAGGGAQKDQRKAVEPSRSSEGTLVGTS
jgi:hypothetical protein